MSRAVEILKAEKAKMTAEIADLRKGVREIDIAIAAIEGVRENGGGANSAGGPSEINAGIIEAVAAGHGAPGTILNFLAGKHIDTTKPSISTRLQKLKADNLIGHDGEKWVPYVPPAVEEPLGPEDHLNPEEASQ